MRPPTAPALPDLLARYAVVRARTEDLVRPLAPEDCVIQSMTEASPVRWHLAHTTWFFETFVLGRARPGEAPFHPLFHHLFNSYYETVGAPFPRPRRGLLSRPTVEEVMRWRRQVDERMEALFASDALERDPELADVLELGLNHEEQHQELIVTDLQHALSLNPLQPAPYPATPATGPAPALGWVPFEEGVRWIGHEGEGFSFDNERPRHRVFLEGFELGTRLVTNAEWMAFMEAGGYGDVRLWLSDGWARRKQEGWEAPLYWRRQDGAWWRYTLAGPMPVAPHEPVCHVSLYEADAFARWAGARLPTEAEWEVAAEGVAVEGHLLDRGAFRPLAATPGPGLRQLFGDAWEWTSSAYAAYPGFAPLAGSLGEYNGKFMCSQTVLRGGSCATPPGHVRPTYRNFFPPEARWQMSGVRLARTRGAGR